MKDYLGIIFAYKSYPELGELVNKRTAASLPVCGRYRLIDFSLSSLRNAGILDVGVVMQRDYQSLLDHIGSGKAWDMSRRVGGLKMLPPFGLPVFHQGNYGGTMEALNSVRSFIKEAPHSNIVLMLGNLFANIDLEEAINVHEKSRADITAICANYEPDVLHHRYVISPSGRVEKILFNRLGCSDGIPSLECYVIKKDVLLNMMDRCASENLYRFHEDGITEFLSGGGYIQTYVHKNYARIIQNTEGYYDANMNILDPVNRATLFPSDRPVRTTHLPTVSTYYGTSAKIVNSLVADECVIEGEIENSIIFAGAKIGKGCSVKTA